MHIFLTGASSGIGEALAIHIGKHLPSSKNILLTLVARRQEKLEEISRNFLCKTQVLPCDLSESQAIQPLLKKAEESFGEIDILINNAGIQFVESSLQYTPEKIVQLIQLNVLTPMLAMNYVLPQMVKNKRGTIVNIASTASYVTNPGMALYSASKACIATYSEAIYAEMKPAGVHVLTVYPGPVVTPMAETAKEAYHYNIGMKLMPEGTPEKLAQKIMVAVDRKKRRINYPEVYGMVRKTRGISQWIADISTPKLKIPHSDKE